MKQKNSKKSIAETKPKKRFFQAHDPVFWAFNKTARVVALASLLNVIGLTIGVIVAAVMHHPPVFEFGENSFFWNYLHTTEYEYALCYGIGSFIYRMLEILMIGRYGEPSISFLTFIILLVISSTLISLVTMLLSYKASDGDIKALYAEFIFYGIDTLFVIAHLFLGEILWIFWTMLGIHIFILGVLGVAIYLYYKLPIKIKEETKNIDSLSLDNEKRGNNNGRRKQ